MNDMIDLTQEEQAATGIIKAIRDRAFEEGRRAGYREGVKACRAQLAELSTNLGPSAEEQAEFARKPLDTPVEELQFTVRAYNGIKREGIHTIGDLMAKSEEDLKDIRNLGSRAVDEIRGKLTAVGYTLRVD